jgi:hypothetical protein
MKHLQLAAGLLPLLLIACTQGNSSPGGTLPELPTGAEVCSTAVPGGAPVYLSLLTDSGESVYQTTAAAGNTVTPVDPSAWKTKNIGRTVAIETLIPAGATSVNVSTAGTQVLLLHWTMWQDKNTNGKLDDGEALPLLTHDRVAYSERALSVSFQTASPKMVQTWTLSQGWSRAAHYVYRPSDGLDQFQRSLESTLPQRYELHIPTPITSM